MVLKYRGMAFRGGYHDYLIRRGGLLVFPRLIASEREVEPRLERIASGIPQLDALLGGGLDRGSSTLIIGAPGTGKSSLAAVYACAAAQKGENAALFIFDESVKTFMTRGIGMGLDLQSHVSAGRLVIQQIDPAEMSPGEFIHRLRHEVDNRQASVIVIDSLNGYLNAMPEERFLVIQLHELLTYLGHAGVATILISAHQGLIGSQMTSPVDASYLADTAVLMRYYETRGEVRQAISVMKKRSGTHERSIRDFRLSADGVHVGPPLRHYRGILTGVPVETPPDEASR